MRVGNADTVIVTHLIPLMRSSLIVVPLIAVLSGCSGESGFSVNDSLSNDGPGGGNLNNGLSGRIYIGDSGSFLDLRSGQTIELGGSWLSPSMDGLEYVSVDEDFERRDVPDCNFSQEFDQVSIYDAASGEVNDRFSLPADIWDVRLSPNRQWVGAFYEDDTVCFNEEKQFTVFSRTGEVIIRAAPDVIRSFDWLPDNRLVISSRGGISVEETAGTLRFRQIADLNGIFGLPSKLSVDPTGTRVLFEMWTASPNFLSTVRYREATVWSVNIDGSDLRERVTSTNALQPDANTDPRVNAPTWSPDGNWFLVTEGYVSGGVIDGSTVQPGVIPINNNGITYVVSADAEPLDLPDDANTGEAARPLIGALGNGGVGPIRLEPFGRHAWVPSP